MMSDSEISSAIDDLKRLTTAGEISWARTQEYQSFVSSDLEGFKIELSMDVEGNVALRISDNVEQVALVSVADDRTAPERAGLLGSAYALLSLVKTQTGSEVNSRWANSVKNLDQPPRS